MSTKTKPFSVPVGPYVVEATQDDAQQLLLLFTEHGHEVCGFVVQGWRTGDAEIVASVGHVPSNFEWGLASVIGTCRKAADEGLIPAA